MPQLCKNLVCKTRRARCPSKNNVLRVESRDSKPIADQLAKRVRILCVSEQAPGPGGRSTGGINPDTRCYRRGLSSLIGGVQEPHGSSAEQSTADCDLDSRCMSEVSCDDAGPGPNSCRSLQLLRSVFGPGWCLGSPSNANNPTVATNRCSCNLLGLRVLATSNPESRRNWKSSSSALSS